MENILLMPPVAFIILFGFSYIISKLFGAFAAKGKESEGKYKAYACGEDVKSHKARPEYNEFFPFAFFFTIIHVVVLILGTVPKGQMLLPLLYLFITAVAVFILFRK